MVFDSKGGNSIRTGYSVTGCVRCDSLIIKLVLAYLWNDNYHSSSIFPQIFNVIPFISSIEEKAHHLMFLTKQGLCCIPPSWGTFTKFQVANVHVKTKIVTLASQHINVIEYKIFREKCAWAQCGTWIKTYMNMVSRK